MAKGKSAKPKSVTKSQVYDTLSEGAGITRKQVAAVMEGLSTLIQKHLKKDNSFTIPGLLKLKLVRKPKVKGGERKPNPFKPGEFIITKDRPARNVVRAVPLKGLKDMVQ